MLEQNAVNVTAIFILFQFFFTCLFFREKHCGVKGISSFVLSALMLLLTSIFTLIYANTLNEFYAIALIVSFSSIYYFVIRSFTELLSIRTKRKTERYYFLFAVAISIGTLILTDEVVYGISIGILASAVIPLVYLLRLISNKVRYLDILAERTFLSHCISLILIGYLLLLIVIFVKKVLPIGILQYLSLELTESVNTASLFWGLCAHISLLIAFLIVIYKFKQDELKKVGETDYLTGVYNRKAFFERVSGIHDSNDTYLILIDADFFKKINDHYGHIAGDEALKHIAKVLQGNISKSDLLARYGGEEFIIAVINTDEKKLRVMVERLRAQMESSPLVFNEITIQITLSIGVSKFSKQDILQDIEQADNMLYQAKANGRNQAVYSLT
ncbi:diguanylate cyclase (GGDEF) domain-containing protein [Arsukibacterium tuosuense]|uniref:diguanylate cyclase n=1 Tax=Arsukibacterium tuosuense TaxID=1323745 RepID=A0A285JGR6_9GAMM|nr:GGDEF domain-containing protein [Arsukibacterium tuosuense]SNY58576.1 diguanylate cyclase (GGDEF) domain-containing protein [Arsukibacterium tuosuense]